MEEDNAQVQHFHQSFYDETVLEFAEGVAQDIAQSNTFNKLVLTRKQFWSKPEYRHYVIM